MIHFGKLQTLYFGKKIILAVLSLLFLVSVTTSCDGYTYDFELPLEGNCESIEAISISNSDPIQYDLLYVIEDENEQMEIISTLSNIDFRANPVPLNGHAQYGLKLNYVDRCVIITRTMAVITDKDLNCVNIREDYHLLSMSSNELYTLLDKYIPQEEFDETK